MKEADLILLRRLVAKNIRVIRNERGYSQEKLADLAELHRTYIGSVERAERNISLDNIGKVAQALGVSPARLLSDD